MAIDFPSSPANGQQFTAGNVTWIWDGVKWGVPTSGGSSLYLPLTGGAMTGPITLAADPTLPMHDVTKRYADSLVNDNRIINGDMRIDQRNNGASVATPNVYTIDRWLNAATQTGKLTWQRGGPYPNTAAFGFPYTLLSTSSSAYTLLSADYFVIYQAIEADAVSDFAWGAAGAQPVTLSFWAYSSKTGSFSGSIQNYAGTRTYPFSFSLPTAATWTKIVVTIPGDTGGTWVMSGNGGSVVVAFDLGTGATNRGPANAWASAGYYGVTGAQSIVTTNGASFNVTGVKLEIGSVATPFNRQSLAKSMADCQRYYEIGSAYSYGYNNTGWNVGYFYGFKVTKRASPTITLTDLGSPSNVSASSVLDNSSLNGFNAHRLATATNGTQFGDNLTASAEL